MNKVAVSPPHLILPIHAFTQLLPKNSFYFGKKFQLFKFKIKFEVVDRLGASIDQNNVKKFLLTQVLETNYEQNGSPRENIRWLDK